MCQEEVVLVGCDPCILPAVCSCTIFSPSPCVLNQPLLNSEPCHSSPWTSHLFPFQGLLMTTSIFCAPCNLTNAVLLGAPIHLPSYTFSFPAFMHSDNSHLSLRCPFYNNVLWSCFSDQLPEPLLHLQTLECFLASLDPANVVPHVQALFGASPAVAAAFCGKGCFIIP